MEGGSCPLLESVYGSEERGESEPMGPGLPPVCDTWEEPREKAWEKSRRAVRDTRRSRQCGETGWTSVTVEVALTLAWRVSS